MLKIAPRDHDGEWNPNGLCFTDHEEWKRSGMGFNFVPAGYINAGGSSGESKNKNVRETRAEFTGKALQSKILERLPTSKEQLFLSKDIREHEYFKSLAWDSKIRQEIVDNAWRAAYNEWYTYSLKERLIKHAAKKWDSYELHVQYYSPEYSCLLLSYLLYKQCGDEDICIQFIDNLIAVADRKVPKKNTFYIFGPHSCGKGFFIDSFLLILWSLGLMGNFDRYCQFPFQDATYPFRAALKYNEPCITSNIEDVLKLLEGDPFRVNIKHIGPQMLPRTPVFMMSNRHPWRFMPEREGAMMDRMFMYTWTAQPFLRNCQKKPTPHAWILLLEKYKDPAWWAEVAAYDDCDFNDFDIVESDDEPSMYDLYCTE